MQRKSTQIDVGEVISIQRKSRPIDMGEVIRLRTEWAYPTGRQIWLKDYYVIEDILDAYPALRGPLSRFSSATIWGKKIETVMFGASNLFLPLSVFRDVVAVGRQQLSEGEFRTRYST